MSTSPRTVLLAGAAGTLGLAAAKVFAQEGAQLVLLDRTPIGEAAPAALAALAPAHCLSIALDLFDASKVGNAVEQAIARFGRIDVLCSLTGGFAMGDAVHHACAGSLAVQGEEVERVSRSGVSVLVRSVLAV